MIENGLKKISIIFTCTFDGGIAYDDDIICDHHHILQKFHDITSRPDDPCKINAVIMGRRTWDLIQVPLENIINVVVTKDRDFRTCFDDVIVVNSVLSALTYCNYNRCVNKVFVIGGASVIEQFLYNRMYDQIVDKIYISVPFCDYTIKADTFIPMHVIFANYNVQKDLMYARHAKNREFASFICTPKSICIHS